MADGRKPDAEDESWTDTEEVRPDFVEAVPIRHGMVLAGRYAIEQIIGRGGSGVVVRAQDRDLRQEVAIKIVRVELVGQRVWATRLAREVKLARQIQHPNVCRVFDFEQAEGRAFLVMELAEKGSLRDELRSGALAARPLAERIADARAVASALAAIHAAGIVHRDVTPQNMLRMGDGRLVLSDFGLATDASESTSIHGGTVAYMAPEVVLSGKASVASDIWALGVVMHEMVFGVKPRWSRAADAAVMLPPELGRKLTKEERAVLDACRACTAKEPARRIGDAEGAGRLLTQRRAWWARRRENRRPLLVAAALVVAVAGGVAVAWVRTRHRPEEARSSLPSAESPLIVPTGEPADWTDISAVIAEVPDRIHCTRLLPDQRTIRFVWGAPPRAEDIDTITRKRVPSPLLPATYAEGCPDLSRDGKRLVYQGHTPDGRAFAFSSEDPHGRGAIPVVPTAEPSLSSEPTWLPDGDAFSYDIDSKHMGVFSMTAKHTTVLPEPTRRAFFTSFRSLSGGLIFVSGIHEVGGTDFVGTSWPSLREDARFRVDDFALDLRLHGQRVYYVNTGLGELVEFDKATLSARRLGRVGTQYIRHETFLADQLAFVSFRNSADLFVQGSDGRVSRVTKSGDVFAAEVCGPNVVVERERGARTFIERIDRNGNTLGEVVSGPGALSPGCSADGKTVFYIDSRAPWAVTSCDQQGCRRLTNRRALQLSVSPDGQRLALMSFDNRGISVWWMPAGGGEMHDVTDRSETLCPLRWASLRTLWVSRRRNGKITWTEVDADSRRETGNVKPGERDCTDGQPDPASPMTTDLRVVRERSSQLRLLDFKYLERP